MTHPRADPNAEVHEHQEDQTGDVDVNGIRQGVEEVDDECVPHDRLRNCPHQIF